MLVDGCTIEAQLASGNWNAFRDSNLVTAADLKIGPNSVDVTLGDHLMVRQQGDKPIDPYDQTTALYDRIDAHRDHGGDRFFYLMPNTLYLGYVRERFSVHNPVLIPPDEWVYAVPMVDGRSTLARLGLTVHETAGFGDYGFEGCFTLEIRACTMMKLYVGMRIAQVSFQTVTPGVVHKVYAGAYSGIHHIDAPVAPRLGRDRF